MVVGLFVAAAIRIPLGLGMMVVAAFALFHGFAHSAEIGEASGLGYAAGFVVATMLLHGIGIGLGVLAKSRYIFPGRVGAVLARFLGAGAAMGGLALAIG